jgi:hypothetical protein
LPCAVIAGSPDRRVIASATTVDRGSGQGMVDLKS